MDPDATVKEIIRTFSEGLHAECQAHIRALLEWIERGGFLPTSLLTADGIKAMLSMLNQALQPKA